MMLFVPVYLLSRRQTQKPYDDVAPWTLNAKTGRRQKLPIHAIIVESLETKSKHRPALAKFKGNETNFF
jgi:hypothetical protein